MQARQVGAEEAGGLRSMDHHESKTGTGMPTVHSAGNSSVWRGAEAPCATPSGKHSSPHKLLSPARNRHESFAGGEQPLRAAAVADHVFAEISAAGELSPCAMARLLALYKQGTLEAALGLVDKRMVQKVVATSGRSLYLVESSGDEPYVCFKHYCPCPYYVMSVLSRPEALACKHILASRIGEALGKIETLGASNEEYICWVHKQEEFAIRQSPDKKGAWRHTPRRQGN